MKRNFKLNAFLMALLSTLLFSCQESLDDQGEWYVPGEYHYSLCVPNANDEIQVVLDSISSPIKSIGACPDWASVTVSSSTQGNHPIICIALKDCGPGVMNEADVEILSEKNDKVSLSLKQSIYITDNENSSDEFLADWENMKYVSIYSDQAYKLVPTPWADETITTLPENIRNDVKKKDGWEMAFSFLNRETFDDCNYFALYNRYLGILRVFLYVTNTTTNGSEYSFEVDMGSMLKNNKYPFYHSLAYGIPSNHHSLPNNVNLLGNGIPSQFTFKSFFSPYIAMSSTALSKGWTAFDIDASAYCPKGKNWLESGEQIQIACRTELSQSISLAGSLSANISGKYSSAEQSASAASGVSSMLSTLGALAGDVQNSALAAIEQQVTGNPLDTYFYYAGVACNVAAFAYDFITENPYEEHVIDSMPGKIEMSMTGDIELSGYIKSLASNGISPITLKGSTIKSANPNSNFGKGVWGITTDPVIYVLNDCMVGDASHLNLVVNGNGTYGNSDVEDYHLRMVSFLDPQSVDGVEGVVINNEIFPDASDIKVTYSYGVYPDIPKGHTTKYASLLGLSRPTLKIVEGTEKFVWRSKNGNNKMKYVEVPHTQIMSKKLDETEDNCKVVKQAGADYSYYGKVVNCEGKNFIMEPQVYLPIKKTSQGTVLCDGEIPDFVVLVNLSFKSNGRTFVFSQRYLPEVKMVSCKSTNYLEYLENCCEFIDYPREDAQKAQDILKYIYIK